MNFSKKLIFIFVILLSFVLISCKKNYEVTLNIPLEISVDELVEINLTTNPGGLNISDFNIFSDDDTIADITDDGKLKGINEGECTIYAKLKSNEMVKGKITIKVGPKKFKATKIELNLASNIKLGEKYDINVTYDVENPFTGYTITSSDNDIISITEGKISANKVGSSVITLVYKYDESVTISKTINVVENVYDVKKELNDIFNLYLNALELSIKLVNISGTETQTVYTSQVINNKKFEKLVYNTKTDSVSIENGYYKSNINGVESTFDADDEICSDTYNTLNISKILEKANKFYKEDEFFNVIKLIEFSNNVYTYEIDTSYYTGSAFNMINAKSGYLYVTLNNGTIESVKTEFVKNDVTYSTTVYYLGLQFNKENM